ncbi:MAG: hypothetical protein AABX79_02515 [Nanoarchaeota archaeon]
MADRKNIKKEKGQTKKEIIKEYDLKDREKPAPSRIGREEQTKTYNKILRNMFIIIGIVVLGVVIFVAVSNSLSRFEYGNIKFEITRFCDAGPPCLVMYRTSLPVEVSGKNITLSFPENKTNDYNFYLRSDPRKLDVDFNGDLVWRKNMVLNIIQEPFICDGKGTIAVANLIQLYDVLGTRVIKDENASCDLLGRYLFVQIRPGNKTSVEQVGPGCYDIYVKDCEILEGTEKFMIETFANVNGILSDSAAKK